MTDWTKEHSDKAAEILEHAARNMIALGMSAVGPWRMMLIQSIEHLSKQLTPAELLGDIAKTRNWLDKLEAEANARTD